MKNCVYLLPLFIAATLLFAACGTSSDGSVEAAGEFGIAPDFELKEMNGGTFRLADHRGSVVIVNFWATWCPPCRAEVPDFVALQDQMRDDGLVIVGVSVDEEGFDVVEPFAAEFGINYPLVVDDGTVTRKFNDVTVLPTTFIVDRNGVIQNRVRGLVSKKVLEPTLVRLLDEEPSPQAAAGS